ncbi:hypothetical protein FRC11_011421, partial [Ceratobasidium sp. 423]
PKCGNAAPAHKRLLGLAVALLQLPNVSLYLDGAHAGWLGWPDNLAPTAAILGEILNNAKTHNAKATVRGLATNVSNYNGLGNQEQQGRDELEYINDLSPLLEQAGYPAHFIVVCLACFLFVLTLTEDPGKILGPRPIRKSSGSSRGW